MHSVTIHKYTDFLTAIEFGPQQATPKNFIVFVGGLSDGFLTVPYVPQLAEAITTKFGEQWVLVQALIRSSYLGFGTGSLTRDCRDLSRLVKYLRQHRGNHDSKVILMGHSTGCQDVMQYLTRFDEDKSYESSMALNGGILQAPVSDREGIRTDANTTELDELLSMSQELIRNGQGKEMLPVKAQKYTFGSPVNAYRFNALLSVGGDDDYFSSDFTHDELRDRFGKIRVPALFLPGEKDEFVPSSINKNEVLNSWRKACDQSCWSKYTRIVPGASHNIGPDSADDSVKFMIEAVLGFIQDEI